MGAVIDQFNRAFRDFNTEGVAASGLAEVDKADARAIGPLIEQAVSLVGLGALVSARFATLAAANASLAYPDGTVAIVFADTTATNNDLVVKTGASGAGNWAPSGIIPGIFAAVGGPLVAQAQQAATLAGHYANDATDNDVIGGSPGERGAKYWANLAGVKAASIGVLDPDAWEDSGWAFFVMNTSNRRILVGTKKAIPPAPAVVATAIASGATTFTALDPDAWEDSGWDSFVIDLKRRVLMGQRKGGSATAAPVVTPDADALYDLVQLSDGANNQTYSTSRATGKLTQLSPAGSNNVPVAIRPDGYAIYKSDRSNGAPGGLYACPVAGGAEIPVMPLRRIVSLGDSLAAGSYIAGSSYQAQAAAALGWECDVFGINGQTARQMAARWGARPMYVTLASNTLLASGDTAITTLTENPITGSVAGKIHGRLGLSGPQATLKRAGDGGDAQAYVLVQDPGGTDTAVPAGTRFYPDSLSINGGPFLAYRYDSIMILSATRNSYERADEIIVSISQIVATLKALSVRFLIAKALPGCDPNNTTSPLDGYGTPTRAGLDWLNAQLTAKWPDNVYDTLAWLQALSDGSAGDIADVAAGVSPRSTRWNGTTYDFLHPNATSRAAMGVGPLKNLIISKGWTK